MKNIYQNIKKKQNKLWSLIRCHQKKYNKKNFNLSKNNKIYFSKHLILSIIT